MLLFSTMLAANIGSGSTVGAAGLGYRDGLSAWWWVGSAGFGSFILALWVGPRIWRIAKKYDLQTVGDFLELKYGPAVRATVAALLWLATVAILAAQLIALAWVLNVVAGIPKALGCLVGGVVMTAYFTAGGLLASAWINLLQLVVLLIGFAFTIPYAIEAGGGWDNITQAVGATDGAHLNWIRGGSSGWIYLSLLVPAFVVSPGLLQKVFGARSASTVRWAVAAQGVALLLFAVAPAILGVAAFSLFPDLPNPELALPMLFVHTLPVWLGSIGLAAVVSAEISSADAILFMLATSLSKDLYHRFVNPEANDKKLLRVARIAAVLGGTLGVLLAIVSPSVIDSLKIFYSLLGVSLFVPVVAGLHRLKGGPAPALVSIVSGVLFTLLSSWATSGHGFGWMTPNLAGLGAAGSAFLVISLTKRLRRTRDP